MPLPKPSAGEDRAKFVARCMDNATVKRDFPKQAQRLAVCFGQFGKKDAEKMEIKKVESEFKLTASNEQAGVFEGHAAIFGIQDKHDDVILAGAFTKALHDHRKKPKRIKMLRQHDRNDIIGIWEEIKEDAKGLFVRGKLLLDIQSARETFVLMKEGVLDSMSIGFMPEEENFNSETGVRELLSVKLFEISVVTFPAQLEALVTSVKHATPEEITTRRDLERALKAASFPVSTAKYITAGWTPPARRDAEGEQDLVESIRLCTRTLNIATGA